MNSILRAPQGEQVSRDEILFDVSKELMSDHGYRTISTTEYGIFGRFNDGGEPMLLSACSDRYELVPNSNIFPVIEAMLESKGFKFEVNYYMDDYSVFEVEYIIKDMAIDAGNGDMLDPVFRIRHSYNGFIQYEMTFGYFRFICTNGLVVPLAGQEAKNFRIKGKHTQKILESIENLLIHIERVATMQPRFNSIIKMMVDKAVPNWEDRVIEVMEATNIKMGRPRSRGKGKKADNDMRNYLAIKSAMECELNDRQVHTTPNEWLIYNAINEGYIYNSDLNSMKPHMREDKDQDVMTYILESGIYMA